MSNVTCFIFIVVQFVGRAGVEPASAFCAHAMPCYPQSLSTHLPVFPGCQSLSRHLSDGVKRPVPLCHRHLSAGNPCAIVALLALESSSKKGVAGGRGLEPLC